MPIAVITGASSGLGREYIGAVIESFPMIDTFWLVARRKDRLKEIADAYPEKTIAAISIDLTADGIFDLWDKLLRENSPDIKVLINAAGYGQCTDYFASDRKKQLGMIDLNCRALAGITRLCLPYMTDDSLIVNVSSIASFVPSSGMAVYCASKSFVTDFSKALRQELRMRGINVLAVCPGPMDTEFFDVAYMPEGSSKFLDSMPRVSAKEVAAGSMKAGIRKKAVYTKGFVYKLYHVIAKIIPHNILMRFTEI